MVEINKELTTFKNKVDQQDGAMEKTLNDLKDRVEQFKTATDGFKDGVSSTYSSENTTTVIEKVEKLTSVLNKITLSLENDLGKALSDSKDLIDKIDNLEKLKQEIDGLQTQEASHSGKTIEKDDAGNVINQDEVNSYNILCQNIQTKTTNFNTLHAEALEKLEKLKSMDASLDFVNEFSVSEGPSKEYLIGGTFERKTFKSSNGVSFSYYLYVPEYSTDVGEIPVHMYLHGQDEGVTEGLPKLLSSGQKANGIVICPQLSDDYRNWENDDIQKALIELTNNVVKTYSGDEDKVSLSGYSIGAIGGYKLVENNPDYFSAFIPIAGYAREVGTGGKVSQTLSDANIWAFYGALDSKAAYDNSTIQQLREMGNNNIDTYVFSKWGHGYVQNYTFEREYEKDGEMVNPLDWAFEQRKQG